jgi:hypothetical protein
LTPDGPGGITSTTGYKSIGFAYYEGYATERIKNAGSTLPIPTRPNFLKYIINTNTMDGGTMCLKDKILTSKKSRQSQGLLRFGLACVMALEALFFSVAFGQEQSPPIVAIDAGYYHSLALDKDGMVWAWGDNEDGQLGDGTTTDRWTPIKVRDIRSIKAISAGCGHSLALDKDGMVWAWGENYRGQLGDGTTIRHFVPIQVLESWSLPASLIQSIQ